MSLNWRSMEDPPQDEQECLVKMKHGIISGRYNAGDSIFYDYYWHDLEWYGYAWVPIEEAI